MLLFRDFNKLEFLNFPIQSDLRKTNANVCILEEFQKLLEKGKMTTLQTGASGVKCATLLSW